jgi:hypothetical protein
VKYGCMPVFIGSYIWLGLGALAHCAEDVDLAGGKASGAGCFAGHDVVML